MRVWNDIIEQYKFGSRNGHALFDKYSEWFDNQLSTKKLHLLLLETLRKPETEINLRILYFIILVIQAFPIDFEDEDVHFDLLSKKICEIPQFYFYNKESQSCRLVYQFIDISFHHPDSMRMVYIRNPELLVELYRKIGNIRYDLSDELMEVSYAMARSISLLNHLPISGVRLLWNNVYKYHFDYDVSKDAKKVVRQRLLLKEK